MSDEDMIRARTDEYAQAFTRGDAKAVAAIFTEDGDFVGPDGVMHHGRAALEQRYQTVFAGEFKGAQASIQVANTRLVRPDIAIVDGTYELNGMKSPEGLPLGLVNGMYTNVWMKKDGQWAIHCLRSMVPVT
jgi:uncharacterized protein (TIGR02246 family)